MPNKLLGVIMLFSSIIVLFFLPWLDTSPVRSGRFRPTFKWLFWLLVIDVLVLGWVGDHRPDAVALGMSVLTIGRLATLYYFGYFLVLLPLVGKFERPPRLPDSIAAAVLGPAPPPRGAAARMERP